MPMQLTPDQEQQVTQEIRAGRTISAIKLFREFTHCGLKEAKDAVETMISGAYGPNQPSSPQNRSVFPTTGHPSSGGAGLTESALREIETLARAGQKIQAIKVWRTHTGGSLADGKSFVESLAGGSVGHQSLEDRAAIQKAGKGGCFSVVLFAFTLGAAGWGIVTSFLPD